MAKAPLAVFWTPVVLLKSAPRTSSSIFVCGVGQESRGAHSCAEVPVGNAQQRVCPDSGVIKAGGEALKGEKALGQVASRAARIGRVTGCSRLW